MKIISDFHDYYDGVAGQGFDKSRTFIRKSDDTLDLAGRKYESAMLDSINYAWKKETLLTPFIVYFAGKTYPGIKVESEGTVSFCYTKEEFEDFKDDESLHHYFKKDKWAHFAVRRIGELLGSKYNYKGFFDYWVKQDNQLVKDLCEDLIEMKESIVVMTGFKFLTLGNSSLKDRKPGLYFIYTPRLKDIEFQRVLDPYTAFQELDMYIGGVLPDTKPTEEVADKYKIQQHGFDKWSFRKHKLDNKEK